MFYIVILTIVRRPDTRQDIRSFPALAVTIVLCAPETAAWNTRKYVKQGNITHENKF